MIKVFMAEDDPLMIRIYDRMFKSSGLELNAAFDGEDAMTKLKSMETKPDIVLLDNIIQQIKQKNTFSVCDYVFLIN